MARTRGLQELTRRIVFSRGASRSVKNEFGVTAEEEAAPEAKAVFADPLPAPAAGAAAAAPAGAAAAPAGATGLLGVHHRRHRPQTEARWAGRARVLRCRG